MSMIWSEHIAAPPERVWSALTQSGVQPFYFNSLFEADLAPGGALRYSTPDRKRIFIEGRVLEIVPGSRLVHEFRFLDLAEPPQKVVFEIEEAQHGTRVTIRHDGLDRGPTPSLQGQARLEPYSAEPQDVAGARAAASGDARAICGDEAPASLDAGTGA
jgi:uncharacterized protein YndB with AHSA1/START domain